MEIKTVAGVRSESGRRGEAGHVGMGIGTGMCPTCSRRLVLTMRIVLYYAMPNAVREDEHKDAER